MESTLALQVFFVACDSTINKVVHLGFFLACFLTCVCNAVMISFNIPDVRHTCNANTLLNMGANPFVGLPNYIHS